MLKQDRKKHEFAKKKTKNFLIICLQWYVEEASWSSGEFKEKHLIKTQAKSVQHLTDYENSKAL